jgi:hypothetical protein
MVESQKTLPTGEDAQAFISAVPDEARREDARTLCGLLSDWTGEPPTMWGTSIVGFGSYRYRYESGREGTAPLVGFSPRKPISCCTSSAASAIGTHSCWSGLARTRLAKAACT